MKKIISFLLFLFLSIGMIMADTESVDFSSQGYENSVEVSSYNGSNFTVSFNKGTNSNVPKYYSTGTAIRIYGGGYFTVNCEQTITKIELTFGSGDGSNEITTNVENYSSGTWSGSATSVIFTVGGTSGHRRVKSITVTYSSGSTPVDPPIPVDPPTPVDNPDTFTLNIGYGQVVSLVVDSVSKELNSISTTSTKYGVGTEYTSTPAQLWKFTVDSGYVDNTFALRDSDNNYLYWTSGNSLNINSTLSKNTSWIITTVNGNAVILNAATPSRQIWWNNGSPRFACYTGKKLGDSGYAPVQLYGSEVEYRTLYLTYPTLIPDGVEVYTAELYGEVLILTEVEDSIPANTGVIVKANIGNYYFIETDPVTALVNNILTGGETTREANYIYYALHNGSHGVGFYKYTGTELPSNKAYIKIPSGGNNAPEHIRFELATDSVPSDTITTRLSTITPEPNNKAYKFIKNGMIYIKKNNVTYNLLGVKVKED